MLANRLVSQIPLCIFGTILILLASASREQGSSAMNLPECSLGWTDDCYTSACIVAWADSNCDGVLSERELNALDDELDGLSRTVPGFRATDVMACRHALPSHLTTIVVRSLYVTCRLPGLRLD